MKILKFLLLLWLLLAKSNICIAQTCESCNEQITPYAPLVPVLRRNTQDWQPIPPPQKTFADDPPKPTSTTIPNTNTATNNIGNCTCDPTKLDSLVLRVDKLQKEFTEATQLVTNYIQNSQNTPSKAYEIEPLLKKLGELEKKLIDLAEKANKQQPSTPIVVNVPPSETSANRQRRIIYLTASDLESTKKTDIAVENLKKYTKIDLVTVVIKHKEVASIKDLPQLIILPDKEQIVGEWNVLNYIQMLTKTQTTPLTAL